MQISAEAAANRRWNDDTAHLRSRSGLNGPAPNQNCMHGACTVFVRHFRLNQMHGHCMHVYGWIRTLFVSSIVKERKRKFLQKLILKKKSLDYQYVKLTA